MTPHGGDVWQVAEEFGVPVAELLDFSANINPRGLPAGARQRLLRDATDPRLLGFYPDPSARALRLSLSRKLELSPDSIVVGAGAEALLGPILRAISPRRALIPIPAFSEYRHVCAIEKIDIETFPLRRSECFRLSAGRFCESIQPGDVVFLNYPHNPSGAMLDAGEIAQICEASLSKNAAVLLDEAFIDYAAEPSLARDAATRSGIVVLRSLTKFFGCPALRVGYAVAHPDTIRQIRGFLPTWPVTQLAVDTLVECLSDREYAEISRRENAVERDRLAGAFGSLGFFTFPSAANYLLLELPPDAPSSSELRTGLIANHRILVRDCDSYEGLARGRYVRVAVRKREENARLIAALRQFADRRF